MNLEKMRPAVRLSKLAFTPLCCFSSLLLMALLFLPARSSSAQCTTKANSNPNPNPQSFDSVGDFNGDCMSDILWRNSATGQVYAWLMSGTTLANSGSPGSPTSDWVIQSVGDFNGDGYADILWRNSGTGEVYIWLMNGTTIANSGSLGYVTSDWSIAGVGDFDGDGKADILWQNSTTGQVYVWLMNGTARSGGGSLGYVSSGLNVVGIGDFDGDGDADILWQNDANGQVLVWLMKGTTIANTGSPGSPTPDWSIAGIGDFDGDGKSDILWTNEATGQIYFWFMNGTTTASSGSPGYVTPPQSVMCSDQNCDNVIGNGWSIEGVGDYDGSGRAGILWRQLATGDVYVWLMNGATNTGSGDLSEIPAAWQISTLAPYGCSNQVLCNFVAETNNIRANGSFGPGNPAPSATPGGPLNPVVWDPAAATVARNWAAQCNFGHNLLGRDGGENIYFAYTGGPGPIPVTGTDVVDAWASEAQWFTYSTNTCAAGEACGHYTQVVWRTTTAMGCGVQQCPGGEAGSPAGPYPWVFEVCDFTPPGNYPWAPY
ncbi:MAG: FG-GAP-like repeat-containing protein [Acidobacteriaceae bacterium]